MNILIIGRGWVGNKMFAELSNRGHYVHIQSHHKEILPEYDYVINCAGYTGKPNVDACEKNKKETIEANACLPILLHSKCEELNIKFAHFSSGCIYQGDITDIDEDPNYFGSIYSISKGISDCYLKNKSLIFRIRMPFTEKKEPKNLLTKLINYSISGKLYDGGRNSLTDLDEAIIVASDLIESNKIGSFNLVNNGSITNKEIVEMLGLNAQWFTDTEFKQITLASRSNCTIPSNTGMIDVRTALEKRIRRLRASL